MHSTSLTNKEPSHHPTENDFKEVNDIDIHHDMTGDNFADDV